MKFVQPYQTGSYDPALIQEQAEDMEFTYTEWESN